MQAIEMLQKLGNDPSFWSDDDDNDADDDDGFLDDLQNELRGGAAQNELRGGAAGNDTAGIGTRNAALDGEITSHGELTARSHGRSHIAAYSEGPPAKGYCMYRHKACMHNVGIFT